MDKMERAKTIIAQLGGMKRLKLMCGAHSFIATDWGLRFLIPRKVIDIAVKDDLYDVTVYRTGLKKVLGRETGVYCDQLPESFERLTGFYLKLSPGDERFFNEEAA